MKTIREFETLIQRCETLAAQNPAAYRWRVAALAMLGFAFVITMITGSLALGLGLIALVVITKHGVLAKIAIFPLWFAYTILKSLWVKLPPPEGQTITAKDAPLLFQEIEDVRGALNAHRAHKVLLLRESFNAAIVQVPRLGLLGWPRNYLLLGLPLMEALQPDQFRAVLGHEFGHLSRAQSRFRNWIYRARQIWPRILLALENRAGAGIIRPFFNWYAPYFNAYSFVLARTNEYDADQAAVQVTSREIAADTLTSIAVRARHIEGEFWNTLMRRAASEPAPPPRPFDEFLGAARFLPQPIATEALAKALEFKTTLDDTHPSLTERLSALGVRPRPVAPASASAAEVFLGPLRDRLIDETNKNWSEQIAGKWQACHEHAAADKAKLATLVQSGIDPTPQQLFEAALAIDSLEGPAAALPLLTKAIALDPAHGPAFFARGRLRVQSGDDSGVEDVKEALRIDPNAAVAANQFLANFYYSRRDIASCQPYADALDKIRAEEARDIRERNTMSAQDTFLPHGLSPDSDFISLCMKAAAAEPTFKKLWLAKKKLSRNSDIPQFVAIVRFSIMARKRREALQRFVTAIGSENLIVFGDKAAKGWGNSARACKGSLIYSRAQ